MRWRCGTELSFHEAFGKPTIITRSLSLVLVSASKDDLILLFYLLGCRLSDWLYIIWAKDTLMAISWTDPWVLYWRIVSDRIIDTAVERALRWRMLQLLLLLLLYRSTFHSLMMAHNVRKIGSAPIDRASGWALFFQLAFVFLEDFIARFNALSSSESFWKVIFSRGLR